MTGAEQRTCPACGSLFTWTPAAPRQKFCSTRCRQRWWDRARRRAAKNDDPRGRHDPRRDDAHGHDGRGHDGHGHDTDSIPTGQPPAAIAACPHCRNPVAIVAWLVPPAAASVPAPRDTPARPGKAINSDRTATLKLSPGGEFR